MRHLQIILIPLIPGLFIFSYVWVVDGGGDFFTLVPNLIAQETAALTRTSTSLLRRILIPGYLLLFVIPVLAYSIKPKKGWLQVFGILAVFHLLVIFSVMVRDD